MRFTSNSVIMKKGVSHLVPVSCPVELTNYQIDNTVWKKAIDEFNQKLDKRPHVTMKLGDFKVDVLKIHRLGDCLQMWLWVKQQDIDTLNKVKFTLKGDLYFLDNSEIKVHTMIIQDVHYNNNQGIINKVSTKEST